jgi:hypothetical protein
MTTKIHALLIGFNHYLPNRFYRSLQALILASNIFAFDQEGKVLVKG